MVYKRAPNTVIAFLRDYFGFLFVGCSITHCVPCFGSFLIFMLCPSVPSMYIILANNECFPAVGYYISVIFANCNR